MRLIILSGLLFCSLSLFAQDIKIGIVNTCGQKQFTWGDLLPLCWTSEASSYFETAWYLSHDSAYDVNDKLLVEWGGGAGNSSNAVSYRVDCDSYLYGKYYLIMKADPQNKIAETNESNNMGISPSISISSNYSCGFNVSVNYAYLNSYSSYNMIQGQYSFTSYFNDPVDQYVVRYYLSNDNVLDVNDYGLQTNYSDMFVTPLSPITKGATTIVNFPQFNYDWSNVPPDGTYYLIVAIEGEYQGQVNGNQTYKGVYYQQITVGTPTGIANPSANSIGLVSPNPAHDLINVTVDEIATADIRDINGKEVISDRVLIEGGNQISITELNPGIYILELTGLSRKAHFRLIKE